MPPVIRQAYFQADPLQGSLRRPTGQRAAALAVEFIQGLHVALVDQFTDHAADILYRSGYEWGLQDMTRMHRQMRQEMGPNFDLWQMDGKFILDTWWTPLAEAGWGRCTFDLAGATRGLSVAELQGSIVAHAFGSSDEPVCHLYAGLLASAVSFFDRSERHGAEVQCRATGAASCLFLIAPGTAIDAAETWRQQGVNATEIVRRLRN